MGRKKSASNAEIKFWLSANANNKEGRFVQAGNSFFLSDEVQKLSAGARWTYMCMSIECGGRRIFEFPLAAAKKYGISKASLIRHVGELETAGFIKAQRAKHMGAKNLYEFDTRWKLGKTASHGYI